jgi:anti-sigma-K factor RskA
MKISPETQRSILVASALAAVVVLLVGLGVIYYRGGVPARALLVRAIELLF